MSIEAMKQALDALEKTITAFGPGLTLQQKAVAALRQAIEQAEQQEPVAWMVYTLDGKSVCVTDNPADFTHEHHALPLYTASPQRKPLTYPQIHELDWPDDVAFEEILLFVRSIEAAHGIGEKA